MTWDDAKAILEQDARWSLCEILTEDEKKELFTQHLARFESKERSKFTQLIDEGGEALQICFMDSCCYSLIRLFIYLFIYLFIINFIFPHISFSKQSRRSELHGQTVS